MRLYLTGPMTGLVDCNRPAFEAARVRLRCEGHAVIDPTELDLDRVDGAASQDPELLWRMFLTRDVAVLLTSAVDGIVLLEGWERSRGSRLEVLAAMSAGVQPLREAEGKLFPVVVYELDVRDLVQTALDRWGRQVGEHHD